MIRRPAVFLDRDGVLNRNRSGYVTRTEQLALIPGAARAVAELSRTGWVIAVVSNQAGVARGALTLDALAAITARLRDELKQAGATIQRIYYCTHAPEADCSCRKPKPGLILRAAEELGLDLPRSFMVGDMATDIECGKAAGVRTIGVETGLPEHREALYRAAPHHLAPALPEAAEWIRSCAALTHGERAGSLTRR